MPKTRQSRAPRQHRQSPESAGDPASIRAMGAVRGLILSTLPSGKKQWAIRYRMGGRQRRHVLGDLATLSLADARDRAREALQAVRDGTDVALVRRVERAPRTDTGCRAGGRGRGGHPARRPGARRRRVKTRACCGRTSCRSGATGPRTPITRAEVRAVVAGIVARGATAMANRTLSIIGRLFSYGLAEDWPHLEGNPASRIAPPTVERSRDRVLTDDELRALWALLGRFPTTPEKQAPGRKRATPTPSASPSVRSVRRSRRSRRSASSRSAAAKSSRCVGPTSTATGGPSGRGQQERPAAPRPDYAGPAGHPRRAAAHGRGRLLVVGGHRLKKAGARLSRALGFTFRSHDLRRTVATRLGAAGVSGAMPSWRCWAHAERPGL